MIFTDSRRCCCPLFCSSASLLIVYWFAGGQGLVTGSQDMTAIVWDCTGVQQRVLRGHTAAIWALTVLPNGQISTGSSDKTVMVWSLDGMLLHTLNGVYHTAMLLQSIAQLLQRC